VESAEIQSRRGKSRSEAVCGKDRLSGQGGSANKLQIQMGEAQLLEVRSEMEARFAEWQLIR